MKNPKSYDDAKEQENFGASESKEKSGRNCRQRSKKNKQKYSHRNVNKKGDINNPGFYYKDQTMIDQVMNFSFNEYGGVRLDWDDNQRPCSDWVFNICRILINPAITPTGDGVGTNGITTAALRNYLVLSNSNSKNTNYGPQEPLILELGLAEVIKIASWHTRCLGTPFLFNYRNRDYPRTLLIANGVDPDDFTENLASYRVRFNTLLAVASKIPFPSGLNLFAKATNLFANYYVDSPNSAMAQTYFLAPRTTWKLNEQDEQTGSFLEEVEFISPNALPQTFDRYLDIFEEMIYALLNSSTLNYVYSDILRLHTTGKWNSMIGFAMVPDGYVTVPVYSDELKDWIHNAIIVGEPWHSEASGEVPEGYTDNNNVYSDPDNNSVKYRPYFQVQAPLGSKALLDFDTDQVTPELKVRATRLSARFQVTKDQVLGYFIENLAVLDNYITEIDYMVADQSYRLYTSFPVKEANEWTKFNIVHTWSIVDKFMWHPMLYWTNDRNYDNIDGIAGDLNFYTFVDYTWLRKVYDYEVMNLLQID